MLFNLGFAALVGSASASILWDGRFNDLTSSTDLNKWSWSNQVGPYQYYIHGSGSVTEYVNLSPSYKNPADSGSKQGAKISLTNTAYWNGQNMRRTELIPQTTAAITSGKVYYHFSLMRSATNPPSVYREHQIAFFESHFTELKSGAASGQSAADNTLRWMINGQTQWSTTWDAGVWHNCAYEINFSANTVAFWHSTGSNPLVLTHAAVSVSTSSNGADWHVGVLELPVSGRADSNEDYYWSGVYIENGSLTTSVAGPGGVVVSSSSKSTTTTSTTLTKTSTTTKPITTTLSTTKTTTKATTTTPASGGGTLPKWSQCAGDGWTGSGTCVAGTTCTYSNYWYSQCL